MFAWLENSLPPLFYEYQTGLLAMYTAQTSTVLSELHLPPRYPNSCGKKRSQQTWAKAISLIPDSDVLKCLLEYSIL